MAIDLAHRLQARKAARIHVQGQLQDKPADARTPGDVQLALLIVQVFKGGGAVASGDVVRFTVPVYREGDVLPPGKRHILWTDLGAAACAEVYLNGNPPDLEMAADEFVIIGQPGSVAVLPEGETGQGAPTKRWWHFWK
jgi:hypothetical protein